MNNYYYFSTPVFGKCRVERWFFGIGLNYSWLNNLIAAMNQRLITKVSHHIDALIWSDKFDLAQMTLIIKVCKFKIFSSE